MRYDTNIPEDQPIAEGIYQFTVTSAQETVSKAGNEQIALELAVEIPGRADTVTVYDYLVSAPKALWKIKTFVEEVGFDWESAELQAGDCEGRSGRATFRLGEVKKNGRQYLEVDRYGVNAPKAQPSKLAKPAAKPTPRPAPQADADGAPPPTDADVPTGGDDLVPF